MKEHGRGRSMKRGFLTGMLLWACVMIPSPGLIAQTPLLFDDIGCGPARLSGKVWSFGVSLTTRF